METHDFSNSKVGDKVSHPTYGDGVIEKTGYIADYQILVRFCEKAAAFTKDGKFHIDDLIPTLYHGHNEFQIIATPKSPYKKDEWIAVKHGDKWKLGQYIGMNYDGWACVRLQGDDESDPPCNYRYHKSLSELNKELNNIEP